MECERENESKWEREEKRRREIGIPLAREMGGGGVGGKLDIAEQESARTEAEIN